MRLYQPASTTTCYQQTIVRHIGCIVIMSDEDWDADNPQELRTFDSTSDEEVESSVVLSPDSLFYPSSQVSGASSIPGTPRTPRAAPSRRGRGRGRPSPSTLTPRRLVAGRSTAPVHQCATCKRRLKTLKGLEKHVLNHKLAGEQFFNSVMDGAIICNSLDTLLIMFSS